MSHREIRVVLADPTDSPVRRVFVAVERALTKARAKHAPMHSAHEGHSVIREEFEELWEHVCADTGETDAAREEALQLAAMSIRYVLDICDGEPGEKVTHGRHCTCTPCRQEDWTRIKAPCGMHGEACPAVYAPLGPAGAWV